MAEERVKGREEALAPVVAKAWKDEKFKKELMSNPKALLNREFGVEIPDNVNVKVVEENANNLYIILPMKPQAGGELTDEQLEAVAGGFCLPVITVPVIIGASSTAFGVMYGVSRTRKTW
jgi:hypothetical protein